MGGEVGKLSKTTSFSKEKLKEMEQAFEEMKKGSKMKVNSTSLALTFDLDHELACILERALDHDKKGEIEFSDVVTTLHILSEGDLDDKIDFCFRLYDSNSDDFLTTEEWREATDTLISSLKKLSDTFIKFLEDAPVELYRMTKDDELEQLTPSELQQQITEAFLKNTEMDKNGKISREDFKAYAKEHPETLIGLIRIHMTVTDLLRRCLAQKRKREREKGGFMRAVGGKPKRGGGGSGGGSRGMGKGIGWSSKAVFGSKSKE